MDQFTSKIYISQLEGSKNWATWKYKVTAMLRGTESAMEAVEGKLSKPILGTGDGALRAYNTELLRYRKAESNALLILTSNMTDETLMKVMRYETAKEVWQELHRLYDGQTEDRAYTLCMQFFSFKNSSNDDVSTMMSKLKNIWNDLNAEILKADPNMKLPELFLICKILDVLDEKFFNFKSSWMLLSKKERTVESLTTQLCGYERALGGQLEESQEVFASTSKIRTKLKRDDNLRCRYCSEKGHRIKNCRKWINDGRPKKATETSIKQQVQNITLMIYTCSEERDSENWYVDNGATTHVTNKDDVFTDFEEFDLTHCITTADGTVVPAKGKGSVEVESNYNGKKTRLTLSNVWYVPTLTKNLFSVLAAQDKLCDSTFISTTKECKMVLNGEVFVVGNRNHNGGLYKLQLKTILPKHPIHVNAVSTSSMLQLYHERFGHQNKRYIKDIVKRELGIDLKSDDIQCEGCIYGKAQRLKFGKRDRASMPGELIHADVCGPFPESYSKYRYFVLFKDDYSAFRHVYFIRNKSDVKDKLLQFLKEAKNAGHVVKTLLSDNGGEFDNKAVREIMNKNGILQRLTMPYTPEQNGCAERENRTLVETARSYMHSGEEFPQALWAELINTAAYVLNRTGPTRMDGKVPFELWHKKKPKISHLRIIGSYCYFHVPKVKRKKLNKKAIKGRLIGYDNDDGYRIWNGQQTVRSRDITFCPGLELRIPTTVTDRQKNSHLPSKVAEIIPEMISQEIEGDNFIQGVFSQNDDTEGSPRQLEQQVSKPELALEGECTAAPMDESAATSDQVQDSEAEQFLDAQEYVEIESEVKPRYDLRNRNTLKPPERFKDCVYLLDSEKFPETYREAMEREDKDEWFKAMQSEMRSLNENNVWTLCQLPHNRKALPCKWIFRIKRNPDGTIDKYKARLVVKGFKQKKGLDYEETFSPVARLATIRALLSVSAQEKLHLVQFDVSTAFLNGELREEIYMKQPDGFSDGSTKVCCLKRSLYGLKQAPRCWNSCFEQILLNMGFEQSEADCCLFTKRVGEGKILITLYVDDGLIAATNAELANSFQNELGNKLKITTKPASYYLGLEIEKAKDGSITIKQESYIKKILQRFEMSECNPISTPIEKEGVQIGKVDTSTKEEKFPYREAVGALAYVMVGTRPDIAYAVGVVSRKLENPTKDDWNKVKRIFRYLKGTVSLGITYGSGPKQLLGYSDADHGGDTTTGRSTTGVVCLYANAAVSWLSQRQATVAISTTEAEIVAASEAARELIWLQRIFDTLTDIRDLPLLKVDNEAAIRLAHNPEFHKRTKHIRIRHYFVREMVHEGTLTVAKTSSMDQLADVLTKAVPKPRLLDLRVKIGINSVN